MFPLPLLSHLPETLQKEQVTELGVTEEINGVTTTSAALTVLTEGGAGCLGACCGGGRCEEAL